MSKTPLAFHRSSLITLTIVVLSTLVGSLRAGDWSGWRGPNGNGIAAAGQTIPTTWSATKNVLWKQQIPGRGHSSPTIVGDRIYLTSADEARQTQAVLAFDRATGKPLWLTPISEGGFPKTHKKNTHATPSVDERVPSARTSSF